MIVGCSEEVVCYPMNPCIEINIAVYNKKLQDIEIIKQQQQLKEKVHENIKALIAQVIKKILQKEDRKCVFKHNMYMQLNSLEDCAYNFAFDTYVNITDKQIKTVDVRKLDSSIYGFTYKDIKVVLVEHCDTSDAVTDTTVTSIA